METQWSCSNQSSRLCSPSVSNLRRAGLLCVQACLIERCCAGPSMQSGMRQPCITSSSPTFQPFRTTDWCAAGCQVHGQVCMPTTI